MREICTKDDLFLLYYIFCNISWIMGVVHISLFLSPSLLISEQSLNSFLLFEEETG